MADASSYPVLFHCWAGADRAGTLAFLLNALLGVSLEDLIRDYELSSLSVWGSRSRSAVEFGRMLEVLSGFGGSSGAIGQQVEHFLLDSGVVSGEIRRFREHLLEDVSLPEWGRFSESP